MYALSLLREYLPNNYHEWEVEFFSSKNPAGRCFPYRKIIQISEYLLKHGTPYQIQSTVQHEVAHAAAFTYGNCIDHGVCWEYFCYYIGCPIDRSVVIDPNYESYKHYQVRRSLFENLNAATTERCKDVNNVLLPW